MNPKNNIQYKPAAPASEEIAKKSLPTMYLFF